MLLPHNISARKFRPVFSSGFTLIEIMVGFTIGLIILSTTSSLFLPTLRSYRQIQAVAELQESERYAYQVFADTIADAGFIGCESGVNKRRNIVDTTKPGLSYSLKTSLPLSISPAYLDATKVIGKSGHSRRVKDINSQKFVGDVLTVHTPSSTHFTILLHNVEHEYFEIAGNQGTRIKVGDVLLIDDCLLASMIEIGKVSFIKKDNRTRLYYGVDSLNDNDERESINCTALDPIDGTDTHRVLLGGNASSHCGSDLNRSSFHSYHFKPGSTISINTSQTFYLATADNDDLKTPTLYSSTLRPNGSVVSSSALIAGVENLRAIYGIRQSSDNRITSVPASNYHTNIDIDEDGIVETAEDVVSLKIYIQFRSFSNQSRSESKIGQTITFPDQFGKLIQCEKLTSNDTACPKLAEQQNGATPIRRTTAFRILLRNQHG